MQSLVMRTLVGLASSCIVMTQTVPTSWSNASYVGGQVLVTFAQSYTPTASSFAAAPPVVGMQAVDSVLASCGATLMEKLTPSWSTLVSEAGNRMERTFLVTYDDPIDPEDIVAAWTNLPYFERVEVNYILDWETGSTQRLVPGDGTAFADQWNLDNLDALDRSDIDAPEAWIIEGGDPSVVIGIFDKGAMIDTSTAEYGWRLHSDFNYYWNAAEDAASPGVINGADFDGIDNDGDGGLLLPYAWSANIIGFNVQKGYDADVASGADGRKRFWYGLPLSWELNIIEPENCGCPIRDPSCPCPNSWEVIDYDQHGVWVASIAAAKLDSMKTTPDIVGIAHNCPVYWGKFRAPQTSAEMASAIEHIARIASVLNMSFGGPTSSNAILDAVITATDEYDCILVAATGNNDPAVNFPAAYDSVLAVGAIKRSPIELTSYSNWTSDNAVVDLVAPVGDQVLVDTYSDCSGSFPCSVANEGTAQVQGTSFAAPQVTGVAALVRSRFPGLTQFDVKRRLIKSAEYYWQTDPDGPYKYGAGKVNAYRALTEWGSIADDPTWTTNALPPDQIGGAHVTIPGSRDGSYYVSGDLTIEAGATLTVDAGTVVRIAPDHEEAGADPDRVQIVVKGTLNINGTAENPVVFESFNDQTSPGTSDWVGIKFESGSSGTISHAVIKNAAVGIENHAEITLTNCTIQDCSVAIDANAKVTVRHSVISDNTSSTAAVDLKAGNSVLTKTTVANNTGAAVVLRNASNASIDSCVVALNGGPVARLASGWSGGNTTVKRTVVYDNTTVSGSPTDADWVTAGVNVLNENPAFCDDATANYELYAFSPAAAGPHYPWRVGALGIGCVPDASVSDSTTSYPFPSGNTAVTPACPAGDAGGISVAIELESAVMTRTVGAAELTLDAGDLAAKVFDSSGVVDASGAATSPTYQTEIAHAKFAYHGASDVDILLNGAPLATKAHLEIRTPDTHSPWGSVGINDLAYFMANSPTGPTKPYVEEIDFNDDNVVSILDFSWFGAHYGHSTTDQILNEADPLQSNAAVELAFTEEFVTSTERRLYVDVDIANVAGMDVCGFSIRANRADLTLLGWQPATSFTGEVAFAPVVRGGESELFFAALATQTLTNSDVSLGRLTFHLAGNEAFEVAANEFVLTVADIQIESGGAPQAAQMVGTMGRTLSTRVQKVFHNRLEQNFPNPFNPQTTIAFSVTDRRHVNLAIFDVAGRRVRELVDERRDRGAYRVVWDGRNDSGSSVASGVYFYKLVAGDFTDTKKMTILK